MILEGDKIFENKSKFKEFNKKELFQISLNSLLKEKIKKKEIINFYDINYEKNEK